MGVDAHPTRPALQGEEATECDASVDTPITEKQLEFGKPEAHDD